MSIQYATIYVGIDNGVSGGVCLLGPSGSIIHTFAMPCEDTEPQRVDVKALRDELNTHLQGRWERAYVCLERPVGCKSARAGISMASTYSAIRGMLDTKGVLWEDVAPKAWQKRLLREKVGGSKEVEIAKAREIWPDMSWPKLRPNGRVVHDGIIDAALIAHDLLERQEP